LKRALAVFGIFSLSLFQVQPAEAATYTEVFTNGALNTSIVITQNGSSVVKNLAGGDGTEAQYHNVYQNNYGLTGYYLNFHQVTTDVTLTFPSNARPTSFSFIASIVNGAQPASYTYEDGTTVNFNVPDTVNTYAGYYTTFTVTGDGRAIASFKIFGGISRDYWAMDNLTWTATTLVQSTTSLSALSTASHNTNFSILATVDAPGKITFYADNKKIAKCISLAISTSITCSWKPNVHKAFQITAKLAPTSSSYLASTSNTITVKVGKRENNR
jgi:hypothetical protein